ncbi:MAG: bifunctional folylpolyglutamate synthase/dihydrofolate synthase [Lachnospiraceae bacterium]|nr:bifunctional folylpolyglutamate synthase/dihydrofolate synthase [Lachnospiraceae bacterium]
MQEMSYERAVEYLNRVPKFSPRTIEDGREPFDLTSITELMNRLGNPQDQLKFIHIAGTNGKGSTAAFLSRILMESGYKVGVYTSPHLEKYTERMRTLSMTEGVHDITDDDFGFLTGIVKERAEDMKRDRFKYPSEFEILTAMAILYFLEQEVDVVVLETGLGGRLDATNIIDTPDLAIITTISYDHMEVLGESLEQIAFEKAGIIKPNGDVLMYPQTPEVEAVFDAICKDRKAWLHRTIMPGKIKESSEEKQTFDLPGLKDLEIRLPGAYQVGNASLAVGAAKILYTRGYDNISDESMRKGLLNTRVPARFEILRKNPTVVVDGSHNEEGAMVLARSLEERFGEEQKIMFIMGVLADKEYDRMTGQVMHLAKKFFTVAPHSDRALPAGELAQFIHTNTGITATPCNTLQTAVRMALSQADESDVICAFGSLYYVGEIRKLFNAGDGLSFEEEPDDTRRPEKSRSVNENSAPGSSEKAGSEKGEKGGLFSVFSKLFKK